MGYKGIMRLEDILQTNRRCELMAVCCFGRKQYG